MEKKPRDQNRKKPAPGGRDNNLAKGGTSDGSPAVKDGDVTAREGIIAGRNAVLEALKAGFPIEKVYVAKGGAEGSVIRILSMASDLGIPVQQCDRVKLDYLTGIKTHQGIACMAGEKDYCTVEAIVKSAIEKGDEPLVIVAEGIEDPYNLGAIIRSAAAAGAHGVVIPKHRGVGVTPAVTKSSAGAVFSMDIARVTNISRAIDELKALGLWIYGTDVSGGSSIYETDMTGPAALVVGSEGGGISRLALSKCDHVVSIPMKGAVSSLNASVAAGVAIYEIVRQRREKYKNLYL